MSLPAPIAAYFDKRRADLQTEAEQIAEEQAELEGIEMAFLAVINGKNLSPVNRSYCNNCGASILWGTVRTKDTAFNEDGSYHRCIK